MTVTKKTSLAAIIPVMFCFFAMGFVDLVGTASNYLKDDLHLSATEANILPSLVFFWFLIFAVPTGWLMNRIGRKNTVLVSLAITLAALILPIFGNNYCLMLLAFSFLGIGNAVMQTSLNPLVSNLISPDKLASTLTLGQFVKAIASFLAPIICAWGISSGIFDLSWRALFPIYAIVCVLSILFLKGTSIKEEKPDTLAGNTVDARRHEGFLTGIVEASKLLRLPFVLLCFFGIMCHVGIDVGTNTAAPRLLQEIDATMLTDEATQATMVYFICRTIGCFVGVFALRIMQPRVFFFGSVLIMLAAMVGLFTLTSTTAVMVCVGMIGFGNSNIFPVIFAQALNAVPQNKNEVSGLMIMGLFGGTIFPLAMGVATDMIDSETGSVAVMTIGVVYLLLLAMKLRKN